ncbi:unnamed protein product [Schistosoma rodhaini]|uniref:Uncharacterized protein n=1 Tax=Schistosoma rodhaini TaxID=6188 RepID=A0AA85G5M5_9TREM|nr:unnamed protein product [Schistosoma rodhaini]
MAQSNSQCLNGPALCFGLGAPDFVQPPQLSITMRQSSLWMSTCNTCPNHLSRYRFTTTSIDLPYLVSTLRPTFELLTRWFQNIRAMFSRHLWSNYLFYLNI